MASVPNYYTSWAEKIAKNSSHGYDQSSRWGPDYDCSSLVITAVCKANVDVKSAGATYTGDMKPAFLKCGFIDILEKGTVNGKSTDNMKRGDILINSHHTCIYCGNGKVVEASINEKGGITGGETGDQLQKNGTSGKQEIGINNFYADSWEVILRYTGSAKAPSGGGGTPITVNVDRSTYMFKSGSNLFYGNQTPKYVVMHWAISSSCSGIYSTFAGNEKTPNSEGNYVAAHYMIGNDGKMYQMIPDNQWTHHCANDKINPCSIGIESCTKDLTTGEYTTEGYNANVKLAAYLCQQYNIDPSTNLYRHYDCSKKACPRWFAPNEGFTDSGKYYPKNPNCESDWSKFKSDVQALLDEAGSGDGDGSYSTTASYFNGIPTDTSQISEGAQKQIQSLIDDGLDAYAEGTDIVIDFSAHLKDYVKYANVRLLKGLQYHPNSLGRYNFRQDYVVIIRKKLYFAGTLESEENYLRVYQLNTFSAVTVNSSVSGNQGTATVSLKGAERIVCIDRADETNKNWQSWDDLLNGLTNIDNEGETDGISWRIGSDDWNDPNASGVDYKSLMKAKEAKYGWKFAEKCDFEPMDELTIYSQSRTDRNSNGQFQFKKIFFGYINSVQKDYSVKGTTITIQAGDQLKLLKNSYVNKSPSYQPGIYNNGYIDVSFATDKFGMIRVNEPYSALMASQGIEATQEQIDEISQKSVWSEVFCGLFPDIIIANCCLQAGIPARYLLTRIEPVKVIPYIFKNFNGTPDYFSTEFKSRLSYCQEIADTCFMEFFQDEEGNIVFKIPNHVLGVNNLTENNMGYELDLSFREDIGAKLDKSDAATLSKIQALCEYCTAKIYKAEEGDTLANVSVDLYGTSIYASEIKYLNVGTLQKYSANDDLPAGTQFLVFEYDVKDSKAREEYNELITNSFVAQLATTLYNEQSGITDTVNTIGVTTSMLTDPLIPEVLPNEIISFVLSDDDSEIYNSIDMNSETFMNVYDSSGSDMKLKRTVPEIDTILRFGVRVAPSVTTPIVSSEEDLELLGHCILAKSAAGRFTASLTMVENPDIKVGNPIRLFTYDEHPNMETGLWDTNKYPEQSIYYINSISRSIKCSDVSTMTLDLTGGRMMGEESIYDKMSPLYLGYYVEPEMTDEMKAFAESYYSQAWTKILSSSTDAVNVSNTDSDNSSSDDDGATADSSDSVGYCFNILKKTLGINTAAACGVLGNLMTESGFDPKASNNGAHLGIAQWDSSYRYVSMKKYCENNNLSYTSLQGQIKYVCYEIKNSYKTTYDYLKQVANSENGAVLAADFVREKYEGCGEQGMDSRRKYAKQYWNKYKKS
jgi:N-acetyl-anhydromuramyl-L-alanine amidase AmpD